MSIGEGDTASTADLSGSHYNTVFERLVEHDSDLVGIVAYALYKKSKRDWCISFRERTGRYPEDAEKAEFSRSYTITQIQTTRIAAGQILKEQIEEIVAEARLKIISDEIKPLREACKPKGWSDFWRDLGVAVLGAFIWSLLVIIIAGIFTIFGIDLLHAFRFLWATKAQPGGH